MIAYEDLVVALTSWRARNGLPTTSPDYGDAGPIVTAEAVDAAPEEIVDLSDASGLVLTEEPIAPEPPPAQAAPEDDSGIIHTGVEISAEGHAPSPSDYDDPPGTDAYTDYVDPHDSALRANETLDATESVETDSIEPDSIETDSIETDSIPQPVDPATLPQTADTFEPPPPLAAQPADAYEGLDDLDADTSFTQAALPAEDAPPPYDAPATAEAYVDPATEAAPDATASSVVEDDAGTLDVDPPPAGDGPAPATEIMSVDADAIVSEEVAVGEDAILDEATVVASDPSGAHDEPAPLPGPPSDDSR